MGEPIPSHIQEIISDLHNKIFIVSDILHNKKSFRKTLDELYDYMKQGFEIKELRTCPSYFKFNNDEGAQIYELQVRHLLTNIMFWEPFMRIGVVDKIDESNIIDCTKISSDLIKEYIDNKIVKPYRKLISNKKMNIILHDMIYNLSRIPSDFNMILGLSMNIETFIDVAKRNPRFNELIRTKIDENEQPQNVERLLDRLTHEEIEILKNEDCLLQPILRSGSGIKDKQLSEFSINGGFKPDLDGNTIPIAINSNFVVGGLGNTTHYYIDSLGGRKAVILNKTVMGRSGHFARNIMLLVSDTRLSKEKDCHSIHPILYEVKTARHLSKMIGRYYRTKFSRQYKILQGDETDLIGEKIFIRSPSTCACKSGICQTCYGELSHTNKHISVGALAGTLITEPISQNILSSKHILTTKSEKMEFNDEFYNFFTINANEIVIDTSNGDDDIKLDDYSLLIIKKNIMYIDQFSDDEYNKSVLLFHVKNNKTGEIIEMKENVDQDKLKELFISKELSTLLMKDKKKDVIEIPFSKMEDEMRLFVFEIENNELTRPLYRIMYLLNRSDHLGMNTVDLMSQTLIDLLIESKIKADAVHGEVLIHALIRSLHDVLERPNFRKFGDSADYQILTIDASLEKNPSVGISLSFQALGRQLNNPLTFRKTGKSFLDPFFNEKVI